MTLLVVGTSLDVMAPFDVLEHGAASLEVSFRVNIGAESWGSCSCEGSMTGKQCCERRDGEGRQPSGTRHMTAEVDELSVRSCRGQPADLKESWLNGMNEEKGFPIW
jgi:hypothetical protein